ncbi:MAG TPA: hypothetical protein VMZ25_05720, partial [Terriglobales bacterium]|nr:hypothetical protein [Terriglobales bacterium]
MKRVRVVALAVVVVLGVAAFWGDIVGAWGNEGHTMINRVAVQRVPNTMPSFLREGAAQVVYLGPEPDRWRSTTEVTLKYGQEPDHFI